MINKPYHDTIFKNSKIKINYITIQHIETFHRF